MANEADGAAERAAQGAAWSESHARLRKRLTGVLDGIRTDLETDDDDRVLRTALYHWATTIKSFRTYYKVAKGLLRERDPHFAPSVVTRQLLQMMIKECPEVPKPVLVLTRSEMLRVAQKLPEIARAALFVQYSTGMRATSVVQMRRGDLTWDNRGGKQRLALRFRVDKRAPHAYGIWRLVDDPELNNFIAATVGVDHPIPDALEWKLRPKLFHDDQVLAQLMQTKLVRRCRHRAATLLAAAVGVEVESTVMGHSRYTARRYMDAAPLEALIAAQCLGPGAVIGG